MMGRAFTGFFRELLALAVIGCFASGMFAAQKKYVDALPRVSTLIPDFSPSRLMAQLSDWPLHHIEGIWQFPANGLEVAIVRTDRDSSSPRRIYDLIVVSSPDRALRAGTLMGRIVPSSKRGEYDARIYTRTVGSRLTLPGKFILTLSDDDTSLDIRPVKGRLIYNLWRLLPYLWRYAVYPSRQTPHADGCIRIFPDPPAPVEPVYF